MVCASPSPAPVVAGTASSSPYCHRSSPNKVAFRHLKPEVRAEMVQEVVCNAMQAFVRLVQLKKTDIAQSAVSQEYIGQSKGLPRRSLWRSMVKWGGRWR